VENAQRQYHWKEQENARQTVKEMGRRGKKCRRNSYRKKHFWAFSRHVPTSAIERMAFEGTAENGHKWYRWKEQKKRTLFM